MNHVVGLLAGGERLDDVVPPKRYFRDVMEGLHPRWNTSNVVIEDRQLDAVMAFVVAVPMGHCLNQVVAEEAGPTGDEQSISGQHLEFVPSTFEYVGEVGVDDLLTGCNRLHNSTNFLQ
jgi:hypothetical protein